MLPFVVKKVIFLVENGYIYGWLFFGLLNFVSYIFSRYILCGYIISVIFSPPIFLGHMRPRKNCG